MVRFPLVKLVRCVEIFYLRAWVSEVVLIVYKYASYYEPLPSTYRYLLVLRYHRIRSVVVANYRVLKCMPTDYVTIYKRGTVPATC